MAEVLAAFSLATDLAIGRPMDHAIRACYIGLHIAQQLRLSLDEQAELYYTTLLMHSGCTADASAYAQFIMGDDISAQGDLSLRNPNNPRDMLGWMIHNVARDASLPVRLQHISAAMLQGPRPFFARLKGYCEVGSRIAQRLGMPDGVSQALRYTFEGWNGKGPYGARGNEIPLFARIVLAAFITEPFIRLKGPAAAEQAIEDHRGKSLDPQIADAFLAASHQTGFYEGLRKEELWDDVLDMEPDSPYRYAPETKLDDVVLAFADFTDLKSLTTLGHSRETARWAERVATRLGLPQHDATAIRRAALVHDLGNAAVPTFILDKAGRLSASEQERMRMHPYYTERILARAPALQDIALIAGAHHERLDGQGYFRGLAGAQLSTAARVLAVADEFQEHYSERPGRPALALEDALNAMRPEVGRSLDPACFDALCQELGVTAPQTSAHRPLPAGLTDREVEVLRLVAKGASNRQIAAQLVISEKTAGHHLEHIYNKIGVSGRAAAVFFAMEHELIA